MPPEKKRTYPWQRKRKRVLLFLLIPVVLAAPFVAYRVQLGNKVESHLAGLTAAGIPLKREALEASRPAVPDESNRAVPILQAIEKFTPSEEKYQDLPFFGGSIAQPHQPFSPQSLEGLEAALQENAAGLDLLREAAKRPQSRFSHEHDGLRGSWPALDHFLAAEAAVLAQNGDAERAIDAILCHVSIAESLREEPSFDLQRLRMQSLDTALNSVGRLVNHVALSDAQSARLGQGITEGIDLATGLDRAVIGETVDALERFSSVSNHPVGGTVALWLGILDKGIISASAFGQEALTTVRLEPLESKVAWMDRHQGGRGGDRGSFLNFLVSNALDNRLGVHTLRTVVQSMLAVERFRLATHQTPESLGALVPQYLDQNPIDPFAGSSKLIYKLEAPGYLLYSVGENGEDDGGAIEEVERRPGRRQTSRRDLGFKVTRAP